MVEHAPSSSLAQRHSQDNREVPINPHQRVLPSVLEQQDNSHDRLPLMPVLPLTWLLALSLRESLPALLGRLARREPLEARLFEGPPSEAPSVSSPGRGEALWDSAPLTACCGGVGHGVCGEGEGWIWGQV